MPRDPRHDYRSVCIYHVTVNKLDSVQSFSNITPPLQSPVIIYSPLGQMVFDNVRSLRNLHPSLKLLQYIVMPDHVHMLIHVLKYLEEPLGAYISRLKINILHDARRINPELKSIFQEDYYDRILRPYHSLNTIYQYIRQNPYRLLVRKSFPEYFKRSFSLFEFGGVIWNSYGNQQLLGNPFKECVVCHRNDSVEQRRSNIDRWMYTASNGGVLVSPFISKEEKGVREMAEAVAGRLILVSNEAIGEREKPGGLNFHLCEQGRLLIVFPSKTISAERRNFLLMNSLASFISYGR